MEFHTLCIQPAHTVQQALRQLDQTGKKILFLTDAAGHLTAALTDGDVRRYLLAGLLCLKAPREILPSRKSLKVSA